MFVKFHKNHFRRTGNGTVKDYNLYVFLTWLSVD